MSRSLSERMRPSAAAGEGLPLETLRSSSFRDSSVTHSQSTGVASELLTSPALLSVPAAARRSANHFSRKHSVTLDAELTEEQMKQLGEEFERLDAGEENKANDTETKIKEEGQQSQGEAKHGGDKVAGGADNKDSSGGDGKRLLLGDTDSSTDDGEYLIRPHLEIGERIRYRYNCDRVVGLDKRDGVFLIGEQCLYVIDNYFIDGEGRYCEKLKPGSVSVLDQALGMQGGRGDDFTAAAFGAVPESMRRQQERSAAIGGWRDTVAAWRMHEGLPAGGEGEGSKEGAGSTGSSSRSLAGGSVAAPGASPSPSPAVRLSHECERWPLADVHEVLRRRYQLRPVALELFSLAGRNVLLVFHKDERDQCYKHLQAMNLPRSSG